MPVLRWILEWWWKCGYGVRTLTWERDCRERMGAGGWSGVSGGCARATCGGIRREGVRSEGVRSEGGGGAWWSHWGAVEVESS